jgi:hypothetical protein
MLLILPRRIPPQNYIQQWNLIEQSLCQLRWTTEQGLSRGQQKRNGTAKTLFFFCIAYSRYKKVDLALHRQDELDTLRAENTVFSRLPDYLYHKPS